MKFVKYNEISIYVDFTVEIQGREVQVKWTTEDGVLADNFEKVFANLTDHEYDQVYEKFYDQMYNFTLDRGENDA